MTTAPHTSPAGDAAGSSSSSGGAHAAPVQASDRPSTGPAGEPTPVEPIGPAARQQVVARQRARYGGISWGAAFFGWLSANGIAVLLVALLSAAGVALGLTEGLTTGTAEDATVADASTIGLVGGITLLMLLLLAYLAGGYVAGRMARFDGVRQGVAVWLVGLLVVVALAVVGYIFGAQYNVLRQLDLPRIPVDEGTATTAGIIALVAAALVTLLGAVLGGLLGARYHRKVDRAGFEPTA